MPQWIRRQQTDFLFSTMYGIRSKTSWCKIYSWKNRDIFCSNPLVILVIHETDTVDTRKTVILSKDWRAMTVGERRFYQKLFGVFFRFQYVRYGISQCFYRASDPNPYGVYDLFFYKSVQFNILSIALYFSGPVRRWLQTDCLFNTSMVTKK